MIPMPECLGGWRVYYGCKIEGAQPPPLPRRFHLVGSHRSGQPVPSHTSLTGSHITLLRRSRSHGPLAAAGGGYLVHEDEEVFEATASGPQWTNNLAASSRSSLAGLHSDPPVCAADV